MRMAVSTTGAEPATDWRTAASRLGRCQRSPAPIHQSSDQPPAHGVTSPRGSTVAEYGEARFPTVVQLRWVTLVTSGASPRGTKAGDSGSSWRSAQNGHSQSGAPASTRASMPGRPDRGPSGLRSPMPLHPRTARRVGQNSLAAPPDSVMLLPVATFPAASYGPPDQVHVISVLPPVSACPLVRLPSVTVIELPDSAIVALKTASADVPMRPPPT